MLENYNNQIPRKQGRPETLYPVGLSLSQVMQYKAPEPAKTGAQAPLGNITNKFDTGYKNDSYKPMRAALWATKNAIKKADIAYKRVHQCGFNVISDGVDISLSKKHKVASVSGVHFCGSVWACPVCRQKILSKRAADLTAMSEEWQGQQGNLFMLTLTVRHERTDSLAALYGSALAGTGLSGALKRFRQSRAWRSVRSGGYLGDMRSIEVTHGNNGFHPHIHMLIFTKGELTETTRKSLAAEWVRSCVKSGLPAPCEKRGCDLQNFNDRPAEYIAKWGAVCELTSQTAKSAKNGNQSIAQLERNLVDGCENAARVLQEYYNTMKGKRLIQSAGSKGWRESLLGRDWCDDDSEIANEPEQSHDFVCMIEKHAWKRIIKGGFVPELLSAVEKDGLFGVSNVLIRLKISPSAIHRRRVKKSGNWLE